jgi:hypothetical protein
MSGPAAARPGVTPRAARVLRYHSQRVELAIRALIALGVIEPADPATGAWWRTVRYPLDGPERRTPGLPAGGSQ